MRKIVYLTEHPINLRVFWRNERARVIRTCTYTIFPCKGVHKLLNNRAISRCEKIHTRIGVFVLFSYFLFVSLLSLGVPLFSNSLWYHDQHQHHHHHHLLIIIIIISLSFDTVWTFASYSVWIIVRQSGCVKIAESTSSCECNWDSRTPFFFFLRPLLLPLSSFDFFSPPPFIIIVRLRENEKRENPWCIFTSPEVSFFLPWSVQKKKNKEKENRRQGKKKGSNLLFSYMGIIWICSFPFGN